MGYLIFNGYPEDRQVIVLDMNQVQVYITPRGVTLKGKPLPERVTLSDKAEIEQVINVLKNFCIGEYHNGNSGSGEG